MSKTGKKIIGIRPDSRFFSQDPAGSASLMVRTGAEWVEIIVDFRFERA